MALEPSWPPVPEGFHLAEDQDSPLYVEPSVWQQLERSAVLSEKMRPLAESFIEDAAQRDRVLASALRRERRVAVAFGRVNPEEVKELRRLRKLRAAWNELAAAEREAWLLAPDVLKCVKRDGHELAARRLRLNVGEVLGLAISVTLRLREVEQKPDSGLPERLPGAPRMPLDSTIPKPGRVWKNRRYGRTHSLRYQFTPARLEDAIRTWAGAHEGCSVDGLTTWIKKRTDRCTTDEKVTKDAQVELLTHLLVLGFSGGMLAGRFGLSRTKVGKIRKERGIQVNKTGPIARYHDDYKRVGGGLSAGDSQHERGWDPTSRVDRILPKGTWTEIVRSETKTSPGEE